MTIWHKNWHVAIAVFVALVCYECIPTADGQEQRWFRIKGVVLDEKGRPAASSTVSLVDTQGKAMRVKQSDGNGRFDFAWLDPRLDYDLHAQRGNAASQRLLITGGNKQDQDVVLRLQVAER